MASAFELIDFGVRITSLDSKSGYTKRNHSIAKVRESNTTL